MDDFDLLRPDDIPPRRRRPGDRPDDPLTELIFSSVSFSEDFKGKTTSSGKAKKTKEEDNKKTGAVESPQEEVPSFYLRHADLTPESRSRNVIEAELAAYDEDDRRLKEKIRASHGASSHPAPPFPARVHQPDSIHRDVPRVGIEAIALPVAERLSSRAPSRVHAKLDALRSRTILATPGDSPAEIRESSLPSRGLTRRRRLRTGHIFIAGLFGILCVGGIAAALLNNGGRFPFSLLSSSSYLVLNASDEKNFPPLFALREEISRLETETEHDALNSAAEQLDVFFKSNRAFSWLAPFKDDASLGEVRGLEEARAAIEASRAFQDQSGRTMTSLDMAAQYEQWLSFWHGLFSRDASYLLIATAGGLQTPALREPVSYALVSVRDGEVSVERSGSIEELNAAIAAKLIPPRPVQVVKTGFDFYEAGWFLDFETAGEELLMLFEETTGAKNLAGVLAVDEEVLAALSDVTGRALTAADPQWTTLLFEKLHQEAPDRWSRYGEELAKGMGTHALQLYLKDESLQTFVEDAPYAVELGRAEGEDALSVGMRLFQGEGAELSLVSHRPYFFKDGSVIVRAEATIDSTSDSPQRAFVKFYVPQGSQLLERAGFSSAPPLPLFDYEGNGFRARESVQSSEVADEVQGFPELSMFHEGSFLAVGGWIDLPARSSKTLSLRYRLGWRLDWRSGADTYRLRVIRPGSWVRFPFKYQAEYEEGIEYRWKDPAGYTSEKIIEYQEILSSDRILSAEIRYPHDEN